MIVVLAGTQDGREAAYKLAEAGFSVLVSVVSSYGHQLAQAENLEVQTGALTTDELADLLISREVRLVVDATHPYAVNVSQNAMEACTQTDTTYLRYERPAVGFEQYDKLHLVSSYQEAAQTAARLGQTVFLTTGSRRLQSFTDEAALAGHRLVARVLPDVEVIAQCLALGFSPKDIIAMQGPFSHELNKTLYKEYQADVIVSKNSGTIGGSDTKFTAAVALDLPIVVIDRPALAYREQVSSLAEVLEYAKSCCE